MVQSLTRRLSKERFRSISLTQRPKLRKRSISDSNLLMENKRYLNNISEERLRSYTAVSNNEKVGKLQKHSISEMDLHHVNIVYSKPDASVSNRNTHCIGINDREEADGAENHENIVENHRDPDVKLEQFEEQKEQRQRSEDCSTRIENEEDRCKNICIEEETSKEICIQEDHEDKRLSEDVKVNPKKKVRPPLTPPAQRKRKTGFSSFSLAKFMTGKIRSRLRSYEPDDPRQLIIAIRNRDINRVRYILEQCPVDVNGSNSKGVTAVHEAALDGQCDMIELLLQHRAALNQMDKDGLTSLDYAVFGGHFECAAYLIDNGARESNIRDGMPDYFKTTDWF